jgi:hypothetical protein
MRNAITIALAAITLVCIATSSEAGYQVRDHRHPTPPPLASKGRPNGQGGVTVTSAPVKCIVVRDERLTFRRQCPR